MMSTKKQAAIAAESEETPVPRLSHRDYQSYWTTTEPCGWVEKVLDQAATWLRDRLDLDFDLTIDSDVHSSDRSKRAQTLHRISGKDRGVRLRVWNSNDSATFIVTLLGVETPRGGWLQINVTSTDPARVSKKPAIAEKILEVVEFNDIRPLLPNAEYTPLAGLEYLEELIDNPNRRLPVIVAAPLEEASFDRWNSFVNKWTRQTVGIAHTVSLDPHAARQFKKHHGDHAVIPGTLRTYPAGAVLSDPATGRVARWLSHQTLADKDSIVMRTIESFVRQHLVSQRVPLPPTAREWSRAFDRIANNRLRQAVKPPTPSLRERRDLRATRRLESVSAASTPDVLLTFFRIYMSRRSPLNRAV